MQDARNRDANFNTYNLDVIVTNPDGGKTKYVYDIMSFYTVDSPVEIEYFDAGGTKMHEQRPFGPPWARTKEIESVFDSNGNGVKSAITTYNRDDNGNLLEKVEYDWVNYGIETGIAIKRKTTYDYYIPAGTDYKNPLSTIYWPSGGPRRLNAVKRMTVYEDSSTARGATEYVYDNAYATGNVMYERRWDKVKASTLPALGNLTSSNSQETYYVYDQYGNVTDIYEPSVSASSADKPRTHITYNPTVGNIPGGSYVTQVETGYGTAEKRTVQYDWYNNGAALWKKKDADNNVATEYTYDNAGRVTGVREISGGTNQRGTWTYYDDANRKIMVKSDLHTYGDGLTPNVHQWSKTHYDQLGRAYALDMLLVCRLNHSARCYMNPLM